MTHSKSYFFLLQALKASGFEFGNQWRWIPRKCSFCRSKWLTIKTFMWFRLMCILLLVEIVCKIFSSHISKLCLKFYFSGGSTLLQARGSYGYETLFMHFLLCFLGEDIPLIFVSVFISVKWELNIYRDQRLCGKDSCGKRAEHKVITWVNFSRNVLL